MIVYESVDKFREYFESEAWSDNGCPIYMTSGGFDPLHVGHVRCILATTDMADADGGYVVVIVNGDGFLERKKGKPFMRAQERAEIIAGLRGVDAAVIWDDGTQTVIGAIEKLKPTYFTKGGDRAEPEDIPEWDICDEVGCKVIFNVGGGKVQSSSWLIEEAEKNAKD
jgi:D-beta-D-heptose 7-phosphate kinase/D-beta-D-heptose 1-phosphate adenosyltransferase